MAGKNVGDIELTVNADTGRLVAQSAKGGAEAGKAMAKGIDQGLQEIGGAKFTARLKKLRAQAEAAFTEIDVDVGVDSSKIQASLTALDKRLKAANLELKINPDIDEAELQAKIVATRNLIRQIPLDLALGFDVQETQLAQVYADVQAIFSQIEAEIVPVLEADDAAKTKANLQAALGEIDVTVGTEVDKAEARLARAQIEAALAGIVVDLDVNVQEAQLALERAKIDAAFNDAGSSAGNKFGQGLSTRLKAQIAGVSAIIQPATVALEGLASQGLAVVSSASIAAASGISALGASFAGLANAAVGAGVGFVGFGSAIGAVNDELAAATEEGRAFDKTASGIEDALSDLSPSAQDAALAFADLREELAASQTSIQEALFAGVAEDLERLGGEIIPDVTAALRIGATQANRFGRSLLQIAADADIEGTFEALEPAVESVLESFLNLAHAVEPFLKAAGPAAENFGDGLKNATNALRQLVREGERSGRLTEFLDDGIDSLKLWGNLLVDVGQLLGTVFRAGQASGDAFVLLLSDIVTTFNEFLQTSAGQDSLANFFQAGTDAASSFGDIISGISEAFGRLTDADGGRAFELLADSLERALPVLGDLLAILGEAGLITTLGNLIALMEPFVALVALLPPEVLQTAAAFLLLTSTAIKVKRGLDGITLSLNAINKVGLKPGPLLAFTAAVAAASVAWSIFSTRTNEAAERSKELAPAIDAAVQSLIRAEDAGSNAALGIEALNQAFIEGGGDGRKIVETLNDINTIAGKTNLTADDLVDVFLDIGEDPVAALTELASGLVDTAEQAQFLGEQVAGTDDNFKVLTVQQANAAEAVGLTTEEFKASAQALEELQDQQEKIDFSPLVDTLEGALVGLDDLERQFAITALAGRDLADLTDAELVEAFNLFTEAQADAIDEAEETAKAMELAGKAIESREEFVLQAVKTENEFTTALEESAIAAADAAREESKLAEATRDIVEATAAGLGVPAALTDQLLELGDSAREAASDAEALDNALGILFGRALSQGAAFDAIIDSTRELGEALSEGALKQLEWTEATSGFSEEATTFRGDVRGAVEDLFTYATEAVNAGESLQEVSAASLALRENLVTKLAEGFGITREAANEYLTTLAGTPEELSTLINTPGLINALLNAEDLNLTYDAANREVVAAFEAAGVDVAKIDTEVLLGLLETVGGFVADPKVDASGIDTGSAQTDELQTGLNDAADTTVDPDFQEGSLPQVQGDVDVFQETLDKASATIVQPTITIPTYAAALGELITLQQAMDTLGASSASPSVSVPGAASSISLVQTLQRVINNLSSKTITITTRRVTENIGGNMTGGLITTPQITQVGERGLAEAIIPLQLPLNRVDPAVRDMAAMVRGVGAGSNAGPGTVNNKSINNTITVNDASGNAETTATKVMNRIAAGL